MMGTMSFFDKIKGLLRRARGDEMISCHDALRLVHEYIDGELEGVSEARVRAHFDVCQRCYPHLHLENAFREAFRRGAGTQTAPPELRAKLVALMLEAESEV